MLLQSVARIVLDDENGTLAEQLEHRQRWSPWCRRWRRAARPAPICAEPLPAPRDLIFDNGLGGFTRDGTNTSSPWSPAR